MNPNIITLGNIEIRWYSFLILCAFILGSIILLRNKKKFNLTLSELTDMLFYLIIFSILGARLYYVIFNLEYYIKYPFDIIKIWEGGLAIHGGIIAGIIYLVFFCKKKNVGLLNFTDVIVTALSLGQSIGRWGNFFNQEAFGPVISYNHLQSFHLPQFIIEGMYIDGNYHHPTFLYESITCIIIFLILLIIKKLKLNKLGVCTSIYLIIYGTERFFIEGLRQDSLMILNIKMAQLVSIIMIIIGLTILIYSSRKKRDFNDK